MEGIIWKWTNYWAGWQPRWFVLRDGALSYYKSREEVSQSCKGSVKMSVCEIIVHPTDSNRLDLVIPSEQHFYLRLATPQERQQWLVALGSAKASLSSRVKKKKQKKQQEPASDQLQSSTIGLNRPVVSLKSKTSELRLYCDLLMQQVHTVKTWTTEKNPPDFEELDDATSLLGATCDTFIKALEECMLVAMSGQSNKTLVNETEDIINSTLLSSSNFQPKKIEEKIKSNDRSMPIVNETNEQINHLLLGNQTDPESSDGTVEENEDMNGTEEEFQDAQENQEIGMKLSSTLSSVNILKNNCPVEEDEPEVGLEDDLLKSDEPRVRTFFSNMKVSFLNMQVTKDGGIPTTHFLESCAIVITIFEMFGSPIFAPMKMDVNGNLRKINEKFKMNSERFKTLQSIIQYEMDTDTTLSRNSATDAIMWLKRGLEFVYEFLLEFHRGNMELKQCALNAYNKTLKQYHGWIVRNVISTATRTVPCRQEVMLKLALKPEDVKNPYYEYELTMDARRFTRAMETIIKILNDYYDRYNLDKKDIP